MKKIISIALLIVLIFSLCACNNTQEEEATQIKFYQSESDFQQLNGKLVKINGFMSLLSPLDGELIYLMNIPFQNCPYCEPTSQTLSNTIAVQGKNIEFTAQPIQVVGTLVFGNFVDGYGYEYSYRIENATITVLDEKEVSEKMRVYYTLAEDAYIESVYMAIDNIGMVAFHEQYGIQAEQFDTAGTIPFNNYEVMHQTVTNLNKNGDYDDFINMIEKTKALLDEVNTALTNKEHDKYKTFQTSANELYRLFSAFINKYEF